MKEKRIFLGLGGNLGDRRAAIDRAREALLAEGWIEVAFSGAFETPPWGRTEQPAFLNAVIEGRWPEGPFELLRTLLRIEAELGRERLEKWGPRLIDIDILSYGDEIVHTQRLTLPHPYVHERAFVLVPWATVAPDFSVPGYDRTVAELLAELPQADKESVVRYSGK